MFSFATLDSDDREALLLARHRGAARRRHRRWPRSAVPGTGLRQWLLWVSFQPELCQDSERGEGVTYSSEGTAEHVFNPCSGLNPPRSFLPGPMSTAGNCSGFLRQKLPLQNMNIVEY